MALLVGAALTVAFPGCARKEHPQVVIYTSLDQIFSERIFEQFEQETGIEVKGVYDTEATKTVGLVNRLIAEKDNPKADVFWNSEFANTIHLKNEGVLAPYQSPSAANIPDTFKDTAGYWTGFAARLRVLVYNTQLIKPEELPKSILDLTDPKWANKFAIGYPIFGTTATHAAAIRALLGPEKMETYFQALKSNGVKILDGNATVVRRVGDGEVLLGLTDTDDVNVAQGQGKPVDMIVPDSDGMGAFLIPNTVGLIQGGPNTQNGKKFIDFLLSEETESKLAFSGSMQIPVRDSVPRPENIKKFAGLKLLAVTYDDVAAQLDATRKFLYDLFAK